MLLLVLGTVLIGFGLACGVKALLMVAETLSEVFAAGPAPDAAPFVFMAVFLIGMLALVVVAGHALSRTLR